MTNQLIEDNTTHTHDATAKGTEEAYDVVFKVCLLHFLLLMFIAFSILNKHFYLGLHFLVCLSNIFWQFKKCFISCNDDMYGDIYHLVSDWMAEAELFSDWWRGGLTRDRRDSGLELVTGCCCSGGATTDWAAD